MSPRVAIGVFVILPTALVAGALIVQGAGLDFVAVIAGLCLMKMLTFTWLCWGYLTRPHPMTKLDQGYRQFIDDRSEEEESCNPFTTSLRY